MSFPSGRWRVEQLAIGGELQPTLAGPPLTLEVRDDGTVSGTGGVNRFRGTVGGASFALAKGTRMSGPHELMAQERIYLRHLASADGFELDTDGDGINLVSRGLIVLTLRSLAR